MGRWFIGSLVEEQTKIRPESNQTEENDQSVIRAVSRQASETQNDLWRMYLRELPPLPLQGGGSRTADPKRGVAWKGRVFSNPTCFADAIRHFRRYLVRNYEVPANRTFYFSNRASVCPSKGLYFVLALYLQKSISGSLRGV